MTKLCKRCDLEKELTEFYKSSKGTGNTEHYCKQCCIEQSIERQRAFKRLCVAYKGDKCKICNYSRSVCALEFHHVDPSKKEFSISKIRKFSTSELSTEVKIELDKCDLLCKNCHAEEHEKMNKSKWKTIRENPTYWPKKTVKRCSICDVPIQQSSKATCRSCSPKYRQGRKEKIKWPNKRQLLARLKQSSYAFLADELGVCPDAIRNRIKNGSCRNRTDVKSA